MHKEIMYRRGSLSPSVSAHRHDFQIVSYVSRTEHRFAIASFDAWQLTILSWCQTTAVATAPSPLKYIGVVSFPLAQYERRQRYLTQLQMAPFSSSVVARSRSGP